MRTVKEIETVTCDMCSFPGGECMPVLVNHRIWDVCSVCLPKLKASLEFLARVVGLDISFALEARDDAS